MYDIYFYSDKRGNEPVLDYINKLANTKGKEARVKRSKINDYIELLSRAGLAAGDRQGEAGAGGLAGKERGG